MNVLVKVWFKNQTMGEYYKEYSLLELNETENLFLISSIEQNYTVSINHMVRKHLNIPKNSFKFSNCINACLDTDKNITILTDVYVTSSYFRILKIEKLLYECNE